MSIPSPPHATQTPPAPAPTEISRDGRIGPIEVSGITLYGQGLSLVTIPLANLRTGGTVTLATTNLIALPGIVDLDWSCLAGPTHLSGDLAFTTTCTYTGPDLTSSRLRFAVLAFSGSQITATLAQPVGITEPTLTNNVATIVIAA